MSVKIRCECGQFLGEFEGKFDIRCRCKKVVKGETVKIGDYEMAFVSDPDLPDDQIRFRLPNKPDQIVRLR